MPSPARIAPSDGSISHKIVDYWKKCLRELILRDPALKERISVDLANIEGGVLPELVAEAVFKLQRESRSKSPKSEEMHKGRGRPNGQMEVVSVVVAPFALTPVLGRSRQLEGEVVAPILIPALLLENGRLMADPNHLPFIQRILLDPPISERMDRYPPPVAHYDEYDQAIRATAVDRQEGWPERIAAAKAMFTEVSGTPAENWLPPAWQRERGFVLPWDRDGNSAKMILPLCDAWLEEETIPGSLGTILSDAPPRQLPHVTDGARDHLGHNGKHALNAKQRDTVRAVSRLQESEVQAVNGPPGTGKTSLLQTLIANAVVQAAIAEEAPPRILITSTNNQAVRNAAKDLVIAAETGDGPERRRWLPDLSHMAAFVASKEEGKRQGKKPTEFQLFDAFRNRVFNPAYAESAEPHFLAEFNSWYTDDKRLESTGETTLLFARDTLRGKLAGVVAECRERAEHISTARRFPAEEPALQMRIVTLQNELQDRLNLATSHKQAAVQAAKDLEDLKTAHEEAIKDIDHRLKKHSLVMRFFTFLPPIEAKRTKMARETAITLGHLPTDTGPLHTFTDLYLEIDRHFAKRKKALEAEIEARTLLVLEEEKKAAALEKALAEAHSSLAVLVQAHDSFSDWMSGYEDPEASDPFERAERRLDLTTRALAFDLAMRMREAEFLLRREEWKAEWATDAVKGHKARSQMLDACSLLMPCTIATVYMAAWHYTYFDGKTNRPLSSPIDLLIYDEAGQVSPELGLPLLGLARRAVAVGDTHQLEPIVSFNEVSDGLVLASAELSAGEAEQVRRKGMAHSNGSVIRAFQAATAFTDLDAPDPGILLVHHLRCVPQIIRYCDDLIYKRLIPCRRAQERPLIAPMSWAHVRGNAEKVGGSWGNNTEAEAIAAWLAARYPSIKTMYGEKSVGIIAPYGRQCTLLRGALGKHLGKESENITVGTIHSLQGAGFDVVIFSPTITLTASRSAKPFMDRGPNMLNVAVSRAKDAFVVIGDMAMFDPNAPHLPSGLLGRHLFLAPENELTDVLPALAIQAPSLIERIDGAERHREILVEALSKATQEVLISSPFLAAAAIKADDVLRLIRTARSRDVEVRIFTGMKTSADRSETDLHTLRSSLAEAGAHLLISQRVHAKTLTYDGQLVVEGSFNWLSASRDPRWANKECSFAVRGPEAAPHAEAATEEFAALNAQPFTPQP